MCLGIGNHIQQPRRPCHFVAGGMGQFAHLGRRHIQRQRTPWRRTSGRGAGLGGLLHRLLVGLRVTRAPVKHVGPKSNSFVWHAPSPQNFKHAVLSRCVYCWSCQDTAKSRRGAKYCNDCHIALHCKLELPYTSSPLFETPGQHFQHTNVHPYPRCIRR